MMGWADGGGSTGELDAEIVLMPVDGLRVV